MSSMKQSFSRACYGILHRLHSAPTVSSKPVANERVHFVSPINFVHDQLVDDTVEPVWIIWWTIG